MRVLASVLALCVLPGLLSAQHLDFGLGFGVKGGVPFTDVVGPGLSGAPLTHDSNYIIGPAAEIRIPFGFAVEVDGLYRAANYHVNGPLPVSLDANSWEVPYLAKFRFPIPLIKPFIEAGGAYRTFTDLPVGVTASHNAFVAGAGMELRISKLRLSAEARYLRWGAPAANDLERLKQDQGEILFGVIF